MLTIRRANDRGKADLGWLKSRFTFSFAEYHDPNFMGFRDLRVINDDHVDGGQGFGMHPHRDMEIFTYVLEGSLQHKDSMGNGSIMRYGDVQLMSAGSGVMHSEFNPSPKEKVHLLQIWILPEKKNLKPSYQQKNFPPEEKKNNLRLIISPDGRDDSLKIHQDANIYASILEKNEKIDHTFKMNRYGWLQVIEGKINVNGIFLQEGDGLAISQEPLITISSSEQAEFLLFDLV